MPAFVRALFIKSSTNVELSYYIKKNVPRHIIALSASDARPATTEVKRRRLRHNSYSRECASCRRLFI